MKKKLTLLLLIPLIAGCKVTPKEEPKPSTPVEPTESGEPTKEPSKTPETTPTEQGQTSEPVVSPSPTKPVDPTTPPVNPTDTGEDKNHTADIISKGLKNKNDQFNAFFDYSKNVEIELDFTNQSITKLREYGEGEGNSNFIKNEIYHPCTGKITIDGVTNTYYELGVRMKGNTSRDTEFVDDNGHFVNDHYCHFKINFAQTFDKSDDNDYYIKGWTSAIARKAREDRKFGGMKKIDLKWNRNYDETFTKELYALEAFRNEGVLAQHGNLVKLTLKTETDTRTMVYSAFDSVEKQLVKRFYSNDYSGDFYKCCYTDRGKADLTDYTNRKIGIEGQNYRPVYNLKTNETTSDHSKMKAFIDQLKATKGKSGQEFYNSFSNYLDIDNFLKYSALCWVFGLPDDFRNNANNYFIYFNKDNKALFLPYDNDRCLGIRNNWDKDCKYQAWNDKHMIGCDSDEQSPLNFRLITGGSTNSWPVHAASQEQFHQYCIEYANKYLDQSKFQTFTNGVKLAPSTNINNGGPENDSFVTYINAKKNTL